MGKDYYKILEVDKKADEEALKKAYKKLGKYSIPKILTNCKKNTYLFTL